MGPTPPGRAKWHFANNDLIFFPFKPFKEILSILAELVHHLNFFLQHWPKLHKSASFRLETQSMIVSNKFIWKKKRSDQVKLIFNFTFFNLAFLCAKSKEKKEYFLQFYSTKLFFKTCTMTGENENSSMLNQNFTS